nr:pentatricopeptide repeat-containing protein At1g79080, chloroplastic-like [Ipomoea batatas]
MQNAAIEIVRILEANCYRPNAKNFGALVIGIMQIIGLSHFLGSKKKICLQTIGRKLFGLAEILAPLLSHCIHRASGQNISPSFRQRASEGRKLQELQFGASLSPLAATAATNATSRTAAKPTLPVTATAADVRKLMARLEVAGDGFSVNTVCKLGFRLCEPGLWYWYYIGLMTFQFIISLQVGDIVKATMAYFVDGSSFRKKGFGSSKPAMAVPALLRKRQRSAGGSWR